jgi:DNA-binding response OmpR family regulator
MFYLPHRGVRRRRETEEHPRRWGRALDQGGIVRLLIAHGDAARRRALREVVDELAYSGVEAVECADGEEAVELLLAADAPDLAVIDWDLPDCEGPEICRRVRAERRIGLPYIILLTRGGHRVAAGLDAGANDCVRTTASEDELQARICVGRRFAELPWERVLEDDDEEDAPGGAASLLQAVLVAQ